MSTKRYWIVPAAVMAAMLLTFAVVEALGVELLRNPSPLLDAGGALAAATGMVLLMADVILPVPSSGVMLAHGALFGIVVGAALSLAGSVGAFSLGFALGRRGERAMERLVSEEERSRADRLLRRWGVLAIVVTRPVPILAETTDFHGGSFAARLAHLCRGRPGGIAARCGALRGGWSTRRLVRHWCGGVRSGDSACAGGRRPVAQDGA